MLLFRRIYLCVPASVHSFTLKQVLPRICRSLDSACRRGVLASFYRMGSCTAFGQDECAGSERLRCLGAVQYCASGMASTALASEMALDFLTVSFASWAVVLGALMSHTLRIILRTVFLRPLQQAQDKSQSTQRTTMASRRRKSDVRVWEAPPFVGKRTFQLIGSCRHWARRDLQSLPSIQFSAEYLYPSVVLGHEEPSVRRTRDFKRPSWHMMKCD